MLWLFHVDPVLLSLHGHNVMLVENASRDASGDASATMAAAFAAGGPPAVASMVALRDSTPRLVSVFPFAAAAFASPSGSFPVSIPGMCSISPEHPCFRGLFGFLFSRLRTYTFQTATLLNRYGRHAD
jgi:hypothetical protein